LKAESEQVPNVKETELAQEMRVMYADRLVEF
jgi:predicted RNase H-like nuclease (RuvC/YqgF family)